MICNLCQKDVNWLIPVKEHKRDHPMTYIVTREICIDCLAKIVNEEKPPKKSKKEETENG